jgi:hypothetical protein
MYRFASGFSGQSPKRWKKYENKWKVCAKSCNRLRAAGVFQLDVRAEVFFSIQRSCFVTTSGVGTMVAHF